MRKSKIEWRSGRRCAVCSPRICRPCYLYVAANAVDRRVKIGMSVRPTRRNAEYRKKKIWGRAIEEIVFRAIAGCEFTVMDKERKAMFALCRSQNISDRSHGDWFDTTDFMGAISDARKIIQSHEIRGTKDG